MKGLQRKTKIVCTIGPASRDFATLLRLAEAGMNIARLNLSHGDFTYHDSTVKAIRDVERACGRPITIMADLPGPKIRIGSLASEPVELVKDSPFMLTTRDIEGGVTGVSVSFERLSATLKPGDTVFINDGLIQLVVERVEGEDVHCRVVVGGELRSRKGVNIPGVDLGISAFTSRDKECLAFCAAQAIDAVCQSFVASGEDVNTVREAASGMGYNPFVIAKIERSVALGNLPDIIEASDGIMVARGDLGVEIPIERMAVVQKHVIQEALVRGRPVITATQMLESMTANPRPTRAEATDVANAVLDGTDCVMLSGESASGTYPVEATAMLARILEATEPFGPGYRLRERLKEVLSGAARDMSDLVIFGVEAALRHTTAASVIVPTLSGATARSIARFRPPVWIVAVCPDERTCRQLAFTSGVIAVCEPCYPSDWVSYAAALMEKLGLAGDRVILAEGPSAANPRPSHRMEIIEIRRS